MATKQKSQTEAPTTTTAEPRTEVPEGTAPRVEKYTAPSRSDDYRDKIHQTGSETEIGAALNTNDPSKVPPGYVPGQPPETQTQNETPEPLAGGPIPGYVSPAEFQANAEGLTLEEKRSGVTLDQKQGVFVSPDEQKAGVGTGDESEEETTTTTTEDPNAD